MSEEYGDSDGDGDKKGLAIIISKAKDRMMSKKGGEPKPKWDAMAEDFLRAVKEEDTELLASVLRAVSAAGG